MRALTPMCTVTRVQRQGFRYTHCLSRRKAGASRPCKREKPIRKTDKKDRQRGTMRCRFQSKQNTVALGGVDDPQRRGLVPVQTRRSIAKTISNSALQALVSMTLAVFWIAPASAQVESGQTVLNDQWQGFWLGQSIGNWTGLITEMDKVGGQGRQGEFYTRQDWAGLDEPAI